MNKPLEAIHLLEDKLKNLLSNYEFLKNENEILLQNASMYQQKLIEQQQLIEGQQQQYHLLKIAKTIVTKLIFFFHSTRFNWFFS